MNALGNILWLILGGILVALMYYAAGILLCITIIGIPFGFQLFKLGTYALWPFGYEMVDGPGQPGCLSIVMNLIWILFGWWEIALVHGPPDVWPAVLHYHRRDSLWRAALQAGLVLDLPLWEGYRSQK